jgi:glycosyltransferase involved in cell wall biosynthesis
MQEGWRYVRAAEVALSPIPRGPLFDVGSPTKAIEYLALGVPIVCNDNPDQAQVVQESQAGLCVPLTADQFAGAVNQILADANMGRTMGQRGRDYIREHRGYMSIASHLAQSYKALCTAN